jgi:AraC-like DNA-binding protein
VKASTRARFFEAPVGRYVRGRSWIFACPCEGLFATFLAGSPEEDDLDALGRSYAVPAAKAPHTVLFDGSRVDHVDARALGSLLELFRAGAQRFTRSLTRVAVVHGSGVAGAVIAGYPKMLPLPETRLFKETAAALEWLGAPAHVRAELVSIADGLGVRDAEAVRLGALLDERPGLSLHEAARALAIAPRTLQRRLREAGTSFQQELDRARLAITTGRLLESNDALTKIAQDVGFVSLQSFTDWFRAQTNDAPSAWRRKHTRASQPR